MNLDEKKVVLTGDRPSGKLHVGHYVGSLRSRVELQSQTNQFVMLADLQALTDNFKNPTKVRENILEVTLDYLSVGIDPNQTTIFIQSQIHAISELTKLYLNFVTVARLQRNPTVKDEIKQRGFGDSIPAGFLVYPVSQAADITCVGAELVPVGQDQVPVIEQCNEIVDSFNNLYSPNEPILKRCKAVLPKVGARLPGIDGGAKMGKSLGNAIYLTDSSDEVRSKVMTMYTDPGHIKVSDPGKLEGNMVFLYLDVFGKDHEYIESLKQHYVRGGLGDVAVKKYLIDVLEDFLAPIRAKRVEFEKNKDLVWKILKDGCAVTNEKASKTLTKVKEVMKLIYF